MRHGIVTKTFGRNPDHRKMLYKLLVTSLIEQGRITTTLSRAKAIRPLVDKMIGLAKEGGLHAKRQARAVILKKQAFIRLFSEVRDDFLALPNQGGYSRILKWKRRTGDNAPMVLMELLNYKSKKPEGEESAKTPTKKSKTKAAGGQTQRGEGGSR
jgi:large subunit ribosomal protein L17